MMEHGAWANLADPQLLSTLLLGLMLEEASEEEAIVRGLGFGFVGAYTLAGKRAIEMMSGQDQPTTLWEKRRGKANEYEEEEEHDEREASHLISSHLISFFFFFFFLHNLSVHTYTSTNSVSYFLCLVSHPWLLLSFVRAR